MARPALLALLLALTASTPAQAAVVRADVVVEERGADSMTVRVEAAPGERNAMTVTRDAGGTFQVRDVGAPLTAGPGCVAVDANNATCTTPPLILAVTLAISVGDLDDAEGDPRSATLTDLGGGDDLIDGGNGSDGVDYGSRATPVAVDLADPAPDGGAGEGDVLVDIENVGGGSAGDVLAGDEGDNRLGGGAGDDAIDGRGGNDRLSDGPGTDVLLGGEGDDLLTVGGVAVFVSPWPFPPLGPGDTGDVARGGEGADTIAAAGSGMILDAGPGDDRFALGAVDGQVLCGDGRDGVSGVLEGRRLDGCELAILSAFDLFSVAVSPLPRARGRLDVPLSCRPRGSSPIVRCRVVVSVRLRRRGAPSVALGRARVSIAEGRRGVARIGPDRRGRRALAAAKRPLLEIGVEGEGVFSSSFHAPGGVKVSQRIAGRWRVRLAAAGA